MILLLLLQEAVVNREFEAWKALKPGTRVTFSGSAKINGQSLEGANVEKTTTLLRVTPAEVVVEETSSIGSPPTETILTAVPEKGNPAERETSRGKEALKIGTRTYPCEWIERTLVAGAGKIVDKVWYCPDVPGGVVKRLRRVEDPEAARELTDILKDWESK